LPPTHASTAITTTTAVKKKKKRSRVILPPLAWTEPTAQDFEADTAFLKSFDETWETVGKKFIVNYNPTLREWYRVKRVDAVPVPFIIVAGVGLISVQSEIYSRLQPGDVDLKRNDFNRSASNLPGIKANIFKAKLTPFAEKYGITKNLTILRHASTVTCYVDYIMKRFTNAMERRRLQAIEEEEDSKKPAAVVVEEEGEKKEPAAIDVTIPETTIEKEETIGDKTRKNEDGEQRGKKRAREEESDKSHSVGGGGTSSHDNADDDELPQPPPQKKMYIPPWKELNEGLL
jgi:hypothetical protein